jgi:hypothetical protein
MVVDSIRRGLYKQPIQVPQHARSWRRRRGVRLNGACACGGSIEAAAWPVSVAWPLSGASGSGPMAEQRESKLEGEVEVCTRALQQRTGLVSTA